MEKKIQVTHLPNLSSSERQDYLGKIERCYDRINTSLPGELLMDIHFHESHKGKNKRELYEIKGNTTIAGIKLNASFSGWEVDTVLRQVLEALEREAEKAKTTKK